MEYHKTPLHVLLNDAKTVTQEKIIQLHQMLVQLKQIQEPNLIQQDFSRQLEQALHTILTPAQLFAKREDLHWLPLQGLMDLQGLSEVKVECQTN